MNFSQGKTLLQVPLRSSRRRQRKKRITLLLLVRPFQFCYNLLTVPIGEAPALLLKAMNAIAMPSTAQTKLLSLAQRLEEAYKKAACLLSDFDKDPGMKLKWWELVRPLLFISKLTGKLLLDTPTVVEDLMSKDKVEAVTPAELETLSYYLEFADMAYDADNDQSLSMFLERVGYIEVFNFKSVDYEVPGFFLVILVYSGMTMSLSFI